MAEITEREYSDVKIALAKAETTIESLETKITGLESDKTELGANIKKAKDEVKAKSDEKLLTITNEKEAIEKELKTFKETLKIGEDVEDLKSHLENLNTDIEKYGAIKEQEEIKTKADIKTYTDFLNEKDAEYLNGKVEVFGESILTNPKALKDFAINQGLETAGSEKKLEVGEIRSTKTNPGKQDSFESAFNSGNIEAMKDSFADNLLK